MVGFLISIEIYLSVVIAASLREILFNTTKYCKILILILIKKITFSKCQSKFFSFILSKSKKGSW